MPVYRQVHAVPPSARKCVGKAVISELRERSNPVGSFKLGRENPWPSVGRRSGTQRAGGSFKVVVVSLSGRGFVQAFGGETHELFQSPHGVVL